MKYFITHLKKELHAHAFDYLVFVISGITFLFALAGFQGQPIQQSIIALIFTGFYIIWGVYHHILENTLHLKTMVEYILIGFTVFFIIKIILFP